MFYKCTLLHYFYLIYKVSFCIRYTYDVTKCMFSSGNITEKLRIAQFSCEGETVVDLYAGLWFSFFKYQYLLPHTHTLYYFYFSDSLLLLLLILIFFKDYLFIKTQGNIHSTYYEESWLVGCFFIDRGKAYHNSFAVECWWKAIF